MDTWMFFKWFFKAAVAIYLVTNTFDIVMAVFDIGQNVVAGAAGVISGDTTSTSNPLLNKCAPAWKRWALANCSACP